MADRNQAVQTHAGISSGIARVIDGGYCIGCGACAAMENSPFAMSWNRHLLYQAQMPADARSADTGNIVCPFSAQAKTEDDLASLLFPEAARDETIGRFDYLAAGYSAETGDRANGSSGGLTTWLCRELLGRDMVDAIIHVKPAAGASGPLFTYQISSSVEEAERGAKSRYYPVEMSAVIRTVRQSPLRYAFVGVPCMVKALRLLVDQEPALSGKIIYFIGIVCGHMKSGAFAEALAWEAGMHPRDLRAIDFRTKIPGQKSSSYGATVSGSGRGGETISKTLPMSESFVKDWGIGWFRPRACDYCDDVIAETADISFGDAWIDKYETQWQGTNIVISRKRELSDLLIDAEDRGRLVLDPLTARDIFRSQQAGFRHRREGLAYRLFLKKRKGVWAPPKRVQPSNRLGISRRIIYRLRMALSAQSHHAFLLAKSLDSFALFRLQMLPLVAAYQLYLRLNRMKVALSRSPVPKYLLRRSGKGR